MEGFDVAVPNTQGYGDNDVDVDADSDADIDEFIINYQTEEEEEEEEGSSGIEKQKTKEYEYSSDDIGDLVYKKVIEYIQNEIKEGKWWITKAYYPITLDDANKNEKNRNIN